MVKVILQNSQTELNNYGLTKFAAISKNIIEKECTKIQQYFYRYFQRDGLSNTVTLKFDLQYNGVAKTTEGHITGSVIYYKDHQDDIGSLVHECVHVMQMYQNVNVPIWLTEGIADYYRYYIFEPGSIGTKPTSNNHYTNGYKITAYFLNWVSTQISNTTPELVPCLNEKAWRGNYTDNVWVEFCGKSAQELWDEMPK